MAKVWRAKDATITVAAAVAAIQSTVNLGSQQTAPTTISADFKGLTITEPELSVDKVDLLGSDSNNFQNAELEQNPIGLAILKGTLLHQGDEVFEPYVATSTSVTGSYTRWQLIGSAARSTCSVLVKLSDSSTRIVYFLLNNAVVTKLGDRKFTGSDGHFEQEVEVTALPRDYYIEYFN